MENPTGFSLLRPELQTHLQSLGIVKPTPVQDAYLKAFFESKKDILMQASTGTGKSLGFLLSLINQRLIPKKTPTVLTPRHLILVPTIMLGEQIFEWCKKLGYEHASMHFGTKSCKPDPSHELLIASPKALRVELARSMFNPSDLSNVILDEADALIKPLGEFATKGKKQSRKEHPNPTLTFLSELYAVASPLRPRMIVSSASLTFWTRKDMMRENLLQQNAVFLKSTLAPEVPKQLLHYHRLLRGTDPCELSEVIQQICARHSPKSTGIVFLPQEKSKNTLKQWLSSRVNRPVYLIDDLKPKPGSLILASDSDARGLDLPSLEFVIILDTPRTPTHYLHMAGRVGRVSQVGENPSVYNVLGVETDLDILTTRLSLLNLRSTPF